MNESLMILALTFCAARHRVFQSITPGLKLSIGIDKIINQSPTLAIILNSMKPSFKEISVVEPIPYPTLEELPSQHCILTIKEMDERLSTLTLDIYSMFAVTQEIKNSLMHLNCSLDYFQKCGVRLMMLIDCMLEHYGIDRYHFSKLMSCIKYCNSQWKRNLIRTLTLLNTYPSAHAIFIYKTNRNLYLWAMLRTNNTILIKMLNKLIENKHLNSKSIKYLHHNSVQRFYEHVYTKMLEVLNEKEEETDLKILLVNQFIKYLLIYLNFCDTDKSRNVLFDRFFTVVQYACRLMKKFYSPTQTRHIKECLGIIKQGLKYYMDFLQRRQLGRIKIQQIKNIVRIINQIPFKPPSSQSISQNAAVMKLIIRILNNWKKIHSKAERIKHTSLTRSTQEQSITQFARKEKENNLKLKIDNGKIDQIKLEFTKLNREKTHLNRRRSQSSLKSQTVLERNIKGMGIDVCLENNVKIRKEIQGNMSQYFTRFQGLKLARSFSKDRKRQLSLKKENQERQLKLQDYSQPMQSRLKIIPNLNKIQLYRPQKMRQFCKKQTRLRIHHNTNI